MKRIKFLPLLFAICLASCEDEKCDPESDELNPVEDLAAYLDPNRFVDGNVLMYYQPGLLPDVISTLGAQQVSGDTFRMRAPAVTGGDTMEVAFIAVAVSTPFYYTTEEEGGDEIVAKHKVYKNAQCKETVGPNVDNDCLFIKEWSLYFNTEVYGWNQCKKGTAFCLELERVVGVHKLYEDTLCSVLVRTEDIKNFSCDK